MILDIKTHMAPDVKEVVGWTARLRQQESVAAARGLLMRLVKQFPHNSQLIELLEWHRPEWWQDQHFASIRLVRRTPAHFDFVWSVILDEEFSSKLKHIPPGVSPKDVLRMLNHDQAALVPESRGIQWVIYKGDVPIGLSMFVNVNFQNRSAEQIMGILPQYDHTFDVSSAYCASLSWAFNSLGLNKVYGLIYGDNVYAATLQERLGFRREGHFKQDVWLDHAQSYVDMVQIGLLQTEFDSHPRLQRLVQRGERSPWLQERRQWPRAPLMASHE